MAKVSSSICKEAGKSCFDTFRCSFNNERFSVLGYDYGIHQSMAEQGETERLPEPRDVSAKAKDWLKYESPFKS